MCELAYSAVAAAATRWTFQGRTTACVVISVPLTAFHLQQQRQRNSASVSPAINHHSHPMILDTLVSCVPLSCCNPDMAKGLPNTLACLQRSAAAVVKEIFNVFCARRRTCKMCAIPILLMLLISEVPTPTSGKQANNFIVHGRTHYTAEHYTCNITTV